TNDADDGSQVGPLLDQIDRPIASFTGDGAYDQDGVYSAIAARHPEAAVIVPPRSNAVPSETAETAPTPRDRHLQAIAEHGRMSWQKASGYNWRALVEADISSSCSFSAVKLAARGTGTSRFRRVQPISPSTLPLALPLPGR